jgi:hypothetical protein
MWAISARAARGAALTRVRPPSPRAGTWSNTGLTPVVGVTVAERCYGDSVCTGVVAWNLVSTIPTPAAPSKGIAFLVNATRAATLTSLGGSATAGAVVTIYALNGSAFTPTGGVGAALSNASAWSIVWGPANWTGAAVDLDTPVPLAAGSLTTLLVAISGGAKLKCTHSLGVANQTLIADATLTAMQAGVLFVAPFSLPNVTVVNQTCAWTGLNLTYTVVNATCAAPVPSPSPPPPPRPDIATSAPDALVGSLDDLLRALANPNVTAIEIKAHVPLNGTALAIALDPTTSTRTLSILGTNACEPANPATPLCSVDAMGLSRVLNVTNGVTLRLGHLAFRNGVASSNGDSGGCIAALCTTCALTIDASSFTNCTASGYGGGLAITGGALTLSGSSFTRNSAAHGGGAYVKGGRFSVTATRFSANTARSMATFQPLVQVPTTLLGPSGGGLKLDGTTGALDGCTFENNTAASTDFVLVANPDLPQARGGGLFLTSSVVSVGASTFSRNIAFYGGGAYAYNSTLALRVCALSRNVATLGDGGGAYAQECKAGVTVADTMFSANTAGGHTGGGIAVLTSPLTLQRSTFTDNTAPRGCGGGAGLDTGATLSVQTGNAFNRNTAFDGGAVCCVLCGSSDYSNSSLFNNVATSGSGGAILSSASTTTLTNVSLFGNTAPQGGAISAISSKLVLTACSLVGNAATSTHGGAIVHTSYDDGRQDMALINTILADNSCKAGGGAVAALSTRTLSLQTCALSNNTINSASPAGGAVLMLNVGRLFMSNCTLTDNKITLIPALSADAPLSFVNGVNLQGVGLGGALWIGANGFCISVVTGTTFTHNDAPSAGAVYVTGTARLTVASSFFYHNHAVDYGSRGGAIVTDATARLEVADTLFFSCEANKGGACYNAGKSNAIYTNVVFEERGHSGACARARGR